MRVVAFVVVAGLAGCGGGDAKSGAKDAAEEFAHAVGQGDAAKACSLMAPELRQQFASSAGAGSCEGAWKKALAATPAAEKQKLGKAHVTSVKVARDRASVRYSVDAKGASPTNLRKIGGKWLLDMAPVDREAAAASLAKSNARNAVVLIETCYTDTQDYSRCKPESSLMRDPAVKFGSGPGQVEITKAAKNSWTITAHATGGAATFKLRKDEQGVVVRKCAPAGAAGCPSNGTW